MRRANLSRHRIHQKGQGLLLVLLIVELGRLLLDVGRLVHRGRLLVHLGRRLILPLSPRERSAVATCIGHRQSIQLWRPLQSGQLWRPLIMVGGLLLGFLVSRHFHHQVAVHVQNDTRRAGVG